MLVFINKFVLYLLSVKSHLSRNFDTITRALLVTHQIDIYEMRISLNSA